MNKYLITLSAYNCEEDSEFEIELSDEELKTIIKLGKTANENNSGSIGIYTKWKIKSVDYWWYYSYEEKNNLLEEG